VEGGGEGAGGREGEEGHRLVTCIHSYLLQVDRGKGYCSLLEDPTHLEQDSKHILPTNS